MRGGSVVLLAALAGCLDVSRNHPAEPPEAPVPAVLFINDCGRWAFFQLQLDSLYYPSEPNGLLLFGEADTVVIATAAGAHRVGWLAVVPGTEGRQVDVLGARSGDSVFVDGPTPYSMHCGPRP